jgi:hypothetical protein
MERALMDDLTQAVIREVVVPLFVALISALAAWLVTKLPGPLRDWLASGTHKRDLELILGAAARRATAVAAGHVTTATPTNDVMSYIRLALPDVVAKLAPSEDALQTIAAAAVSGARAEVRAFDAIAVVRNGK